MSCGHPKITKKYVGSTETYDYCSTCMETSGGEEGPEKRALIAAAAAFEASLPSWDTYEHERS